MKKKFILFYLFIVNFFSLVISSALDAIPPSFLVSDLDQNVKDEMDSASEKAYEDRQDVKTKRESAGAQAQKDLGTVRIDKDSAREKAYEDRQDVKTKRESAGAQASDDRETVETDRDSASEKAQTDTEEVSPGPGMKGKI
ncbi:MAG: hypothetical protein FJZ58_07360 [Chlamydiae bacterium]|nr:hypothetical protein [Chlamydiota bacterium]